MPPLTTLDAVVPCTPKACTPALVASPRTPELPPVGLAESPRTPTPVDAAYTPTAPAAVAVTLIARVPLEASGGVRLDTIRAIAETGVNYISVGRITQSAPAVDIGLDYILNN